MKKVHKTVICKLKVMLVMTVAIALLLALVPTPVGACDDCTCFDDPDNSNLILYLHDANADDGSLNTTKPNGIWGASEWIFNGDHAWWISEEASSQDQYFGNEIWKIYLRYWYVCELDESATLTAEIWALSNVATHEGRMLAQGTSEPLVETLELLFVGCSVFDLVPGNNQQLFDGEFLALKITFNGSGKANVRHDSGLACSRLEVVPPIPEIATGILLGMGLLGLVGFVWFKRRQKVIVKA
ncbi:MAG: hypothetical protein HQ553_03115 [Chloroflexi bacterium]|nr:hypothetical protein [Chloroflexota bacterium]